MADDITKTVGEGWTWFTDYAFVWAEWIIRTPADRKVQVGMGVFSGGEPRGEKFEVVGQDRIKTLGVGAIHIKVVDGGGPCNVTVALGDKGLIPIIRCASANAALTAMAAGLDTPLSRKSYFSLMSFSDEEVALLQRLNQSLRDLDALVENKRELLHAPK